MTDMGSMVDLDLPSQITPFTPPSDADCTISVYCPFMTYWIYTSGEHMLSSMECQAVNVLEDYGAGAIGYNTDCLPEGYYTIFADNLYVEISSPTDLSTMAYPGTACVSGWTTACTTTVTDSDASYPQAWCCPPGSWQCAADSARHCTSVMTESTNIWMTWDPPFTGLGISEEYYTWTAGVTSEPSEYAATVYHRVFPLQLTTGGSDTAATQPVSSNGTSDNGASEAVLSMGAKAGIGVAAAVVLLGVLVGWILFVRRRKKRNAEAAEATEPNANPPTEEALDDKPELEGTTVAQARSVIPKVELDARYSERGTVSTLGTWSPNPTESDGIFPSPESRHRSVFEMPG